MKGTATTADALVHARRAEYRKTGIPAYWFLASEVELATIATGRVPERVRELAIQLLDVDAVLVSPRVVPVPDIEDPRTCFKQSIKTMVRCSLRKGHRGPHSWQRKRIRR